MDCRFIIVILIGYLASSVHCKLPSTIKTCSRNLPKPENCILREVEKLRPKLATGDLGDGFTTPPLEPMALDNINFQRGPEFSAKFNSLMVNGPSLFVVEKLKADIPNLSFNFTVMLPKISFTGKYSLKMRLLLLNIQGRGDVNGTMDNSRGYVRLQGGIKPRNGKNYVSFDQLAVKISVGKSKFHLSNLFNGDPLLGDVTNQFINENSELFVAEMIPGFEKSLSKTFLDIVNVIMKEVTYDEMFPDV